MSLQSYLDNLNSSNHNVNELLDLLDDPQNALTFFGGRVVTVANREGSVYLNELIEKVIHAINPVFEQNGNPNQSCGEILNKLELCIQKSNAIIEGANCLLWLLNYLREQFFWVSSHRQNSTDEG